MQNALEERITTALNSLQVEYLDSEDQLSTFRDTVYESSLEILGKVTCKYQDWFNKNYIGLQELLNEKKDL